MTQTWFHVGRNLETGVDEEILKGKPWMQVVTDVQGNIYTSTETSWRQDWLCEDDATYLDWCLPNCNRYPNTQKQKEKDNLVARALKWRCSVEAGRNQNPIVHLEDHGDDVWGNVVKTTKYGQVAFSGDHELGESFSAADVISDVGFDDEMVEVSSYLYDVDQWLIGLSLQSGVHDLYGNWKVASRKFYDEMGFAQASTGLLTKEETCHGAIDNDGDCLGRWIPVNERSTTAKAWFRPHGTPTTTWWSWNTI